MKIYSNAQFNNPFAQYVGKNVWIKVHCLFGSKATIYIRVLEDLGKNVSGDHFIKANWIKSIDVGRLRAEPGKHGSLPGAYRVRESTHNFAIDDLEIVQPLDVIPGEELFPTAKNLLPKEIIGHPIWVKCDTSSYSTYYVRFNDIIDDVVHCDFIDNYNVEEYEYEGPDGNLPSEEIRQGSFFIDVFIPHEPLELLTDEELDEILNENDEIYWKGYRRDDAGNYFNDED